MSIWGYSHSAFKDLPFPFVTHNMNKQMVKQVMVARIMIPMNQTIMILTLITNSQEREAAWTMKLVNDRNVKFREFQGYLKRRSIKSNHYFNGRAHNWRIRAPCQEFAAGRASLLSMRLRTFRRVFNELGEREISEWSHNIHVINIEINHGFPGWMSLTPWSGRRSRIKDIVAAFKYLSEKRPR
jgi:hypothetical protein